MEKFVEIKVYKNGELIQECKSIQEAGHWLKGYTGDNFLRFSKIERGYCYEEPWDFNGARYTFQASEEDSNRRRLQLNSKKKL
jgi:hypothetical protein